MITFDIEQEFKKYLQLVNLHELNGESEQYSELRRAFYGACGQMTAFILTDAIKYEPGKLVACYENIVGQVSEYWQAEVTSLGKQPLLSPRVIDGNRMRELASIIKKEIPGYGFAIVTFPFGQSGAMNYVSNAKREDMIKAVEELLDRWKSGQHWPTPESN